MNQLIFFTYLNRSGSTFLCQKLSEYNNVLVCPEAEILIYNFLLTPSKPLVVNEAFKKHIEFIIYNDIKLKYWGLSINNLINNIQDLSHFDFFYRILDEYRNIVKPNAKTIVFKGTRLLNIISSLTTSNFSKYNILLIGLVRDPRAIYFSQNQTPEIYSGKMMCNNPILLAKHWNWYTSKIVQLEKQKNLHIISFESLIENFHDEFDNLLDILDVDKKSKSIVGDLYKRIPENQKSIHFNILKDPDSRIIEKWKNATKIEIIAYSLIEKYAGNNLLTWDYIPLNNQLRFYYYLQEQIYIFKLLIKKIFNPNYWYDIP